MSEDRQRSGKPDPKRPPVYTVWEEFVGWTLDRTAGIPKSQRFTFGQRIDAYTLDVLELIVEATFTKDNLALLDAAGRMLGGWSKPIHEISALTAGIS